MKGKEKILEKLLIISPDGGREIVEVSRNDKCSSLFLNDPMQFLVGSTASAGPFCGKGYNLVLYFTPVDSSSSPAPAGVNPFGQELLGHSSCGCGHEEFRYVVGKLGVRKVVLDEQTGGGDITYEDFDRVYQKSLEHHRKRHEASARTCTLL